MNNSPRWARTSKIAAKFIQDHKVCSLPVNPFNLIAQHLNWKTKTYDAYADRHGVSIDDIIDLTDSEDGCAYYQAENDRYLILYNNNPLFISEPRRITWTLIHEIGHICLKHLEETGEAIISRSTLNTEKYQNLEAEADFFAATVLAPYVVLHTMDINHFKDIQYICGLSKMAAQNRENGLRRWKNRKRMSQEDLIILRQFQSFIYKRRCLTCGHGLISKVSKYCPICGDFLIWGEGVMIYNDGFELDVDSKALQCPRCKNDEIVEHGAYCKICGTYLINKCADKMDYNEYGETYIAHKSCGYIANGNARFCINCGNPTTFYLDELLSDWEQARDKIAEVESPEVVPW